MVDDPSALGEPLKRVVADLAEIEQYSVNAINEVHGVCSAQMTNIHQDSVKWRDQYEGGEDAPRSEYYSGTADTYPNITFKHCDTAAAKSMAMLFPSSDFFENAPADMDSRASATIAKQTLLHFLQRGDFVPKIEPGIENVCVDGTVIVQNMWTYKLSKKRVRTVEPKTGDLDRMKQTPISDGQMRQDVELQVTDDYPDIEIIDLQNFFVPDSTVDSIGQLDFLGKRFWTTLRGLRRDSVKIVETNDGEFVKVGIYENTDLLPQTQPPVTASQNTKDESVDGVQAMPATLANLSVKVEVLEYYFTNAEDFFESYEGEGDWRDYLIDKWDFDELEVDGGLIVTVANGQVPIRFAPMVDLNGDLEKMFVLGRWIPKRGSLFGIGIPEMIREYQLEACAQDNQALDNLSYQISKHFFYDDSIGLDPADFGTVRPGMGTPITSMIPGADISNMLHENVPQPLPNDFWSWRTSLRREVEEIDGITDIMMGGSSSNEATATEVSARTTASEVRFLRRVKYLERNLIAKLLQNFWDLIDDLVDETLAITIMSKNGDRILSEVKRSQLMGSYIFKPVGAREMQDKFLKSQQMITMLNNPELLRYHDVPAVLSSFYENLGFHNPGKFVKDPMRRRPMLDVEMQWKAFMLGQPVEVTGDETMEEHDEAIRAHGETFLKDFLPALINGGVVPAAEGEMIKDLAMQNVETHARWIEQKQQEQAEQERMMALEQTLKAGGNQNAIAPSTSAQVNAASGQFPGPVPASVGA
jgi:hypothetical protein